MVREIGLIILGFAVGSSLACLIMYLILSRKTALIEGRALSAEAVNNELRQQVELKTRELDETRSELQNEAGIRAAMESRYHEAEKNLQTMEKELLDKFSTISLQALSRNSDEFLKLAEETLRAQTVEGVKDLALKKELIDRSITEVDKTLADVKQKIEAVGKGNIEVSTLIRKHEDITLKLRDTTEHLREALASSKKRGEWGERMAEDIIRLVGLVESVNYVKQKTLEGSTGRPDYTFFMPNRLKINMDVKLPLDNYVNYLNASTEQEKKRCRDDLLRNTKTMIKQVTSREYINPADNTVDYVLLFIPNEQVYGFINESDTTIMDEALKQKVILCSPFTLYAVLAVIRQSVENFNLERTASEILKLMGEFARQWNAWKERFAVMGKRLGDAVKEYDALVTTRSNMLERPLKKIDDLRQQKEISLDSNITLDD
ncbi:MAG: DNA recombination protein RmuC [Nitrospiraceae bacterium]|nr:MAG: DNA recombination protein RmuC [Nitrospiraceae bacterium]